jgi:hypothetical protein
LAASLHRANDQIDPARMSDVVVLNQRECFEVCPDKFSAVVKLSGEPVPEPLPLAKWTLVKGVGEVNVRK